MRKREVKTALEENRFRFSARPAFTLVEMLVVVSILLILTVAVVAVAPRFTDDRKLSRAADQLAQILLTSKTRAKRDLVPMGVRLFPDPQHNNLVTQLQYIQQPDDFGPAGTTVTLTAIANNATIDANIPASILWPRGSGQLVFVAQGQVLPNPLDFTGGFANQALWPVQPGDYLSVKGTAHLILAVTPYVPGATPIPSRLILAPVAPCQPSGSAGTPTGNTIPLVASANAAQIAPGMSLTGSWAGTTATSTNVIKRVNNTSAGAMSITLTSAPGPGGDWLGFLPAYAVSTSPKPTAYSIIRRPRVLQGETPLQLPAGICIDPNTKFPGDTNGFTPPVDIMFSPQGNLMNSGLAAGQDSIILWVRDYTKDLGPQLNPGQPANTYPVTSWPPGGQPGEQFVIFIQTHTGFIAEHPVDVTPGNGPYTFTQDARASGL